MGGFGKEVVVGERVGRARGARRGRGSAQGPVWVLGVLLFMALSTRITTTCVALHDRRMRGDVVVVLVLVMGRRGV